jgi:hypothetical protein
MGGLSTAMILGALIIVAAAVIARLGLPGTPTDEEAFTDVDALDADLIPVAA